MKLTDYDVLLARRGVTVGNVTAKNYQAYLPVNLGPIPVAIKRGHVAADLTIFGQVFRVVSTHPEPQTPVKEIQEAQVAELLQDLSTATLPVVVAGDFNSHPDDPANSPWDQMTQAGFTDLWTARIGRPEQSATCCHAPNLRNATSMLDRRLDYVWGMGQGRCPAPGRPGRHDGVWRRGRGAHGGRPLAIGSWRPLRRRGPAAKAAGAALSREPALRAGTPPRNWSGAGFAASPRVCF